MSKKKIAALGVTAVLIYAVGFGMGDSSAISRVNEMSHTTDASNSASSSTPANDIPVSASASPEIKQIGFGQAAKLGQFEFKVLKVENTKEAKTATESISTTTNTYEIVKLEVVNKRNAPAQLQDFKVRLTDLDKKTVYDLNSDVSIGMSTSLHIYDKKPAVYLSDDMNPNLKNEFTGVFEVPTDGNYALSMTYNNDSVSLKLK